MKRRRVFPSPFFLVMPGLVYGAIFRSTEINFQKNLKKFLTTEDGPIHLRRIGLGVARREEGKNALRLSTRL